MKHVETVKIIVPVIENGTILEWIANSEPDCRWRLANQKIIIDDNTGSVTINEPPSSYDSMTFRSRQEAELHCAAVGFETLDSFIASLK